MNAHTLKVVEFWRKLTKAKKNRYVFVNSEKILDLAKKNIMTPFQIPNWRYPGVYSEREWAFVSQQLFANVFNAHFNIFEKPDSKYALLNRDDAGKPYMGAFALQRAMYEHFGERIIHSSDIGPHVATPRKMAKFFGGDPPMPSPELKQNCGLCFAVNLEKRFQGNPLNLLEESMVWSDLYGKKVIRAYNNGRGLIELLSNAFGAAYADYCYWQEGNELKDFLVFNKRAQLVAVLLHGRALDSKCVLPLVEDIDEIGPIADYEVPKALRALGILEYSPELALLVDNWKEIPEGSRMELEIRAATVAVCEELMNQINIFKWHEQLRQNRGEDYIAELAPINICHLDYWLWKMGKDAKHLRPHLTRTSAY